MLQSPLLTEFLMILSGMILCLWGLRIFKIYIISGGVIIGAAIGMTIGLYFDQADRSLLLISLASALVGGILAWPLQKWFILLITGLFSLLIGSGVLFSFGLGVESWWITGLISFVIGAFVAWLFFDYIIIVILALTGGQLIFWHNYPDSLLITKGMIHNLSFGGYLGNLTSIIENNLWYMLCLMIVFTLFSVYFQKLNGLKSGDSNITHRDKVMFRRTTYLFMILYLFFEILARIRFLPETYFMVGYDILAWPIVSIITALFVVRLGRTKIRVFHSIFARYFMLLLFGAIVIPPIGYVIAAVSGQSWTPEWLFAYYRFFTEGDIYVIIIKAVFGAVIFPLLFLFPVMRRRIKPPPQEIIPEKEKKIEPGSDKPSETPPEPTSD